MDNIAIAKTLAGELLIGHVEGEKRVLLNVYRILALPRKAADPAKVNVNYALQPYFFPFGPGKVNIEFDRLVTLSFDVEKELVDRYTAVVTGLVVQNLLGG